MKRTVLLLLLLVSPWRSGAQDSPPSSTGTSAAVPESAEPGTPSTRGVIDGETRELRPGDMVRYRIEQDPTAAGDPMRSVVNAVGDLHLSVCRRHDTYVTVNAQGKTLDQIRADFKSKLDSDYYVDATVVVDLESVDRTAAAIAGSSGRVTFFGELRGTVAIPDGREMLLSEAVLQLPTSPFADLKRVRIHRIDPVTDKATTLTVDVDEILFKNKREGDEVLMPDDRIEIQAKRFRF